LPDPWLVARKNFEQELLTREAYRVSSHSLNY
jgi:hypothetical protein